VAATGGKAFIIPTGKDMQDTIIGTLKQKDYIAGKTLGRVRRGATNGGYAAERA
jgi:hypothetical protein